MKNLILPIISCILIISCNVRVNPSNKEYKSKDNLAIEDFDSFKRKFYSDSIFQINRIIFPLEEEESEKEYVEVLKDSNINEINRNKHTSYDKSNWNILTDTFFKNDSIATINGVKYKRKFYKSADFVEENILYADPVQVMMILKFKLVNNKWYMVDFRDGFADE